jgi:hypothetical protein
VVVDRAAERSVAVRDPVGSSYGIPEAEFLAAMRYTVAVFEKGK